MIYNIGSTPISSMIIKSQDYSFIEADFDCKWGLSDNIIESETIIAWAENIELNSEHLLVWSEVIGVDSNTILRWLKTLAIENDILLLWAKTFGIENINNLKWGMVEEFGNNLSVNWGRVHWLDIITEVLWAKTGSLDKEQIIPWGPMEALDFALEFNWSELSSISNDTEIPWVKVRELSVTNFSDWVPGVLDVPKEILSKDFNLPWLSVARIIMTEQNIQFKRVVDNEPVAIVNGSFGIDKNSWSWTFSGTIPSEAELNKIKPNPEGEVEVELTVNGYVFTFLIDGYKKNYQWGKGTYNVTGKSTSCVLGSPYSTIETKIVENLTAEQIISTTLQDTGWTYDWQLTSLPWYIGDQVSFYNKTKIEIISIVAKAIGGMVQTHPNDKKIILKKKMPVSPSEFASATPDEVCLKEYISLGADYYAKPKYDNIIVSGSTHSVTVRRYNTSGLRSAPEVVEPLLISQNLCVERGTAELNEEGYDKMSYNLDLPLPAAGTSTRPKLLLPGDLYRVTDKTETWTGVVTTTSIGWERGKTRQRVEVERPLL